MRPWAPVAFVLLFAVAAATMPGAAQNPLAAPLELSATVEPHGELVAPIAGVGIATVDVVAECVPPANHLEPVVLTYRVEVDSPHAITIGSWADRAAFDVEECKTSAAQRESEFEVHFTFGAGAPAGDPVTFRVFAAQDDGEERELVTWTETPDHYIRAKARLAGYDHVGGPRFDLSVLLWNGGNGPVVAEFSRVDENADVLFEVPQSVTVPVLEEGEAVEVDLALESLATGHQEFLLGVTFHAPDASSATEPEEWVVRGVVRHDGLVASATALGPLFPLLLAGALLGVFGRRPSAARR